MTYAITRMTCGKFTIRAWTLATVGPDQEMIENAIAFPMVPKDTPHSQISIEMISEALQADERVVKYEITDESGHGLLTVNRMP